MNSISNNPAPWARTPPADPLRVLREIGAEIDKQRRRELQAVMREQKKLESDFERLCSESALKKNREHEFNLHSDLSVTAEAAAQQIRQLRQFQEDAPIIRARIDRERAALLSKLFPMAAELCAKLIEAIDAQLEALPKFEMASRWGIAVNDGELYNLITYPLLRLRSILEYDLPLFKRGNAQGVTYFTADFLLASAGLLGDAEKPNEK